MKDRVTQALSIRESEAYLRRRAYPIPVDRRATRREPFYGVHAKPDSDH
jgi:hypothetical protein